MAINNAPLTKDITLNTTLFELIQEINKLERKHLRLIQDIRQATSLADLKVRIDKK